MASHWCNKILQYLKFQKKMSHFIRPWWHWQGGNQPREASRTLFYVSLVNHKRNDKPLLCKFIVSFVEILYMMLNKKLMSKAPFPQSRWQMTINLSQWIEKQKKNHFIKIQKFEDLKQWSPSDFFRKILFSV